MKCSGLMWTIHWGKNKVAEYENWKKKLLCYVCGFWRLSYLQRERERVYKFKKIQTGLTLLHHNLKGVIQCFENGVHVAPNV